MFETSYFSSKEVAEIEGRCQEAVTQLQQKHLEERRLLIACLAFFKAKSEGDHLPYTHLHGFSTKDIYNKSEQLIEWGNIEWKRREEAARKEANEKAARNYAEQQQKEAYIHKLAELEASTKS